MEQLWYLLDGSSTQNSMFTAESVLLSLLLAFVLGQGLAWVYYATHSGVSYSRSFVQSLVLIPIVVALVMVTIGNSLITAVGLMGAVALVRFRNAIKDTRDVTFLFCALVVGMAAGSQRYAIAIAGTAVLAAIAVYLHLAKFGCHRPLNAFLCVDCQSGPEVEQAVAEVLACFCDASALVTLQRDGPEGHAQYAYQLSIRESSGNDAFLTSLRAIPGVNNVSFAMQEEVLEV